MNGDGPILRITSLRGGFHEYLGPFVSRNAALDAARAVRRLAHRPEGLHFQLGRAGRPHPVGYYEDITWETRQGEHWPVAALWDAEKDG